MRVSTAQIYAQGVAAIAAQQEAMLRTQQQVASGKRVLSPGDDPVASTQALALDQAKAKLGQYQANIGTAKDALGLDESALAQISDLLDNVRTLAVNGGNAGLTDADRLTLANDVASRLAQLVGLANSKDGTGNYMFAGFNVGAAPFTSSTGGVVYSGDQGVRALDVAPSRVLALTENGSALFEQIRNGNGAFATTAVPANAGTGVIDQGQVVGAGGLSGHTYQLQFNVVAGVTTYDVYDVTAASTVSTGNAYTSGAPIAVAGTQVAITGAPAAGDVFTLAPSSAQSVFATIQNLVATLSAPATGAAGATRLANGLNAALTNLDQALDHVLDARASVGARLRELDSLTTGNDDRSLQYDQAHSHLVDLDYNQALSDFAKQQIALQAAQKSFVQVSGLSLFNYL